MNYKGGKPNCIDCGKTITYHAKRCNFHSNKLKSGKNHYNWKEIGIGYRGIHVWITKMLGKANECKICQKTNAKRYCWANISHKYKRDISDWVSLCYSCHKIMDLDYLKQ